MIDIKTGIIWNTEPILIPERIRPCGSGWAYCNGLCTSCERAKSLPATSSTGDKNLEDLI